jgi:hypothetical protein
VTVTYLYTGLSTVSYKFFSFLLFPTDNSSIVLRLLLCLFPSVRPFGPHFAQPITLLSYPACAFYNTQLHSSKARPDQASWPGGGTLPAVASPATFDPEVKATLPSEHHCLLHLHKQPTNYSLLFDNLTIIHFLCTPEVKYGVALNVQKSRL